MNEVQEKESLYHLILAEYGITPIYIEELGKVKKITTINQQQFALKETTIPFERADAFIYALRQLTKLGYKQFVPIIPTRTNEYTVRYGDNIYYLMPWVEEYTYTAQNESMEEKLASQLGIIHRLTVETRPFEDEHIEWMKELVHYWEMRQLHLIRYADEIERHIYYSPFELTFLTHAYQLEQMANYAKDSVQKWAEYCEERGKYRIVLCHGRLKRSHARFHYNNEPYLFNFEDACIDSPARDLALFYRYNIPKAYWIYDEMFKWLHRYEQHLPLLKEEKYLLSAYLNFPEPVFQSVQAYQMTRGEMSELEHVERLERRLKALENVRYFTQTMMQSLSTSSSNEGVQ